MTEQRDGSRPPLRKKRFKSTARISPLALGGKPVTEKATREEGTVVG